MRRSQPAAWAAGGWSDLASELCGVILSRVPSLADRARFRCVCRQWRHAAKQQWWLLPPPFPWLFPTASDDDDRRRRRFVSLPDGATHHIAVPQINLDQYPTCEAFGEWLHFPNAETGTHLLVNPLVPSGSGATTIELPPMKLLKLVVCPGGDLVAAIACVHLPPPTASPSAAAASRLLYALYGRTTLYAYGLDDCEPRCVIADPRPITEAEERFIALHHYDIRYFLVPGGGGGGKKLLLVRSEGESFVVFEADGGTGRWSEVAGLDDGEALFVSANCSGALPVYGGAGNCVFFVWESPRPRYHWSVDRSGRSFRVYDMSTKTIRDAIVSPLKSHGCHTTGSWLFPSLLP
ncbi:uncharacterized protein LOC104583927 [Brachypodium distachyon]|uniref:uncharacterized protein LOC104583927 n=1 Tax=Brachypodium distachyon TaxID=15368 RepID=UPI00052FE81C|nr:uncharacterized protein LOC104583927 [Brachypodium distachyon]|eukprot:XP_010236254.1 uncharacterized protein LOC104583927 [Brachypodium distachyon]